ncbi:hypothetical protein [Salinicola aestuarinus]|uniref:hypothetical protein n=1 Tax=Salinicola aestuarinus TaxID=1949082 RepID=UPI000DA1A196|nr:hypothetical protein [Salinicola aestuarinus]
MNPPSTFYYHHDRADLRGVALITAVLGLAVVSVLLPLLTTYLPSSLGLPASVMLIVLWLGVIGVYGARARRAKGRQEKITIDDTGFDSRLYGRIAFDNVERHRQGRDSRLWRFEVSAPSLMLVLTDRRRVHFHLDSRHYTAELLDYLGCLEAILVGLGQRSVAQEGTFPSRSAIYAETLASAHPAGTMSRGLDTPSMAQVTVPNETARVESKDEPRPGRATDNSTGRDDDVSRMSKANRAADKRATQWFVKHRKWQVIAALLLSLSYFIRACGPEIKSTFTPNPLEGMQETSVHSIDLAVSRLERAIAGKGPVYLWGEPGDASVKPVLLPNVTQGAALGIDTLDRLNTASDIRKFLDDGEVEGYQLGLAHGGEWALPRTSRISTAPVEGEYTLSFFLLMPEGVAKTSQAPMDSSAWQLHYRNLDELAERLRDGQGQQTSVRLPAAIVARWLQMTPSPRLYVAASAYQGMSDADFAQATRVVARYYREQGVDVADFERRRFETGSVEQGSAAWGGRHE